jgi:hypothetical protein
LFTGLSGFSNKLPVKPLIRMDFLKLAHHLPNSLKLRILFTAGPAAQKVISDPFLLFGLQFSILVS